MANLVLILLVLFISLVVLVKLTEKRAKPMSPEQQAKLSRWLMPLVFLMLLAGLLRHYWQG